MVNLLTTPNQNLLKQMKFQKQSLTVLFLNIGLVGIGLGQSYGILKPQPIVQTPPPPHLTKGGIDFLKFGNKGGDEIFFLEREGLD